MVGCSGGETNQKERDNHRKQRAALLILILINFFCSSSLTHLITSSYWGWNETETAGQNVPRRLESLRRRHRRASTHTFYTATSPRGMISCSAGADVVALAAAAAAAAVASSSAGHCTWRHCWLLCRLPLRPWSPVSEDVEQSKVDGGGGGEDYVRRCTVVVVVVVKESRSSGNLVMAIKKGEREKVRDRGRNCWN